MSQLVYWYDARHDVKVPVVNYGARANQDGGAANAFLTDKVCLQDV